jgi:RNA polymerase primary sigma factor
MRQLKITKQITGRETASLNKYLQEINREQLITAEEEAILARKIKQGDEKAIEMLTKANLRFVVSVAKQFQNCGLPLCDLINEGNIGLIKAAQRFDETRGFKLISYAVWYIRQAIQDAINEQSHFVRLPSSKIDRINKVRKAVVKMEQQFAREPSDEEIGVELSLSTQTITETKNISKRQVSMDAPIAGSDNLTLMDMIEDTSGENAEVERNNKSLATKLESIIATLPSREAEVLRLYFGLNNKKSLSLKEIGDRFGFSTVRALQLKNAAMIKLRNAQFRRLLQEYLG